MLASLLLLLLLVAIIVAVTCRPAWYEPQSIDYARLEEDKRTQLHIENQVSAALNQHRSINVELTEAQINRWIAARDELWPGQVPSLEPLHRPMIRFLDGNRVSLAAEAQRGALQAVVSLTLEVTLAGENVEISWSAARAGALPLPRGFLEQVAHKLEGAVHSSSVNLTDGRIVLPRTGLWPNGKRRFRVAALTIEAGRLRIQLEPLE